MLVFRAARPHPNGMKTTHRTLARLPRGYSITPIPGTERDGLPAFLAGSEGEAELLLFEPPDFKLTAIARAPGGYISAAPLVRNGRRYAVSSTLFKPGFDAADSSLSLYPLDGGECPPPASVARIPYSHRVASLRHAGRDWILVSTLCAAKAFKDDWTQPGGIHLVSVPDDLSEPWPVRQIVAGLNKNHGLDFALLGRERRPGYLLSAMEGLFFMPLPAVPEDTWHLEQIFNAESSDAFAFDWDGDGEPEVFSISPFHGNVLAVHKRRDDAWRRVVIHDDLALGHVVWAGDLLGGPALLAGSRRERRELRLYRPTAEGGIDPGYRVIDEGIGPTQIAVFPLDSDRVVLYVAAHGIDEVRIYELTA